VEPRRFQLEGPTLSALKAQVLADHGGDARIVAAEKVLVGGIRGFFARQHYEVTVEVPAPGTRVAEPRLDLPTRLGIAALLDDADDAETRLQAGTPGRIMSTESRGFAALLDELSAATALVAVPAPARPVLPRPLGGAGDLVLVIGTAADSLTVAGSMAAGAGEVCAAGTVSAEGVERVDDRRSALGARARGVGNGHGTFVAFGLGPAGPDARGVAALQGVGADQVWVVVDAGRKSEDTARWVQAVAAAVPVDAIAAEGLGFTSSPGTVEELGLPIAWKDGAAAAPNRPGPAGAPR
jgi:hypothetical protein